MNGEATTRSYLSKLVYYELVSSAPGIAGLGSCCADPSGSRELNESEFKEKLLAAPEHLVSRMHVLHGNRSLLVVAASDDVVTSVESLALLESLLQLAGGANNNKFTLKRMPIPLVGVEPIYLSSELSATQLSVFASDKSQALELIAAKTGLVLTATASGAQSSGLLFQFNLLNDMLLQLQTTKPHSHATTTTTEANTDAVEKQDVKERHNSKETATTTGTDWLTIYNKSEHKLHIKLKPKEFDPRLRAKAHSGLTAVESTEDAHSSSSTSSGSASSDSFEYDVYVFQADLTELNTDALVDASKPDLHPGYEGLALRMRMSLHNISIFRMSIMFV